MDEESVLRLEVSANSLRDLRTFLDAVQPDLGCRGIARKTDRGYVIDAYLPESQVEASRSLEAASKVSITVIENATEIGLARQADVGQGNRYAARSKVPRGLGRKE